MENGNSPQLTWLFFALSAVLFWGFYGVFLHSGQMTMSDPIHGRFKAFLFVGIAYLVTAVISPVLVLKAGHATWTFPAKGVIWSVLAGTVGAMGAFCVLKAFGAKGTPPVVMSIVFAGAPIVNAVVASLMHPPEGGWGSIRWQFLLGILFAALGGLLVTLYRPGAR